MGLTAASCNLNGSLHLGPCRNSPCQCFLPGRISLYKCHGGNCFPESFIADLTRAAWCVLLQGGCLSLEMTTDQLAEVKAQKQEKKKNKQTPPSKHISTG